MYDDELQYDNLKDDHTKKVSMTIQSSSSSLLLYDHDHHYSPRGEIALPDELAFHTSLTRLWKCCKIGFIC